MADDYIDQPEFSEENYPLKIPPDISPEHALEIVVGLCYEMRHPLNKIDGLLAVLQDDGLAHLHDTATRDVVQWMGGIRYILNIVYNYDEQRPYSLDD